MQIDFFCVILIFVNLIPGLPNLTVIRTTRMLKPLRSISRFPTLKTIVSTMVRSAQDIFDVYIICLFVFMVFGVVCMDLFGGALAQRCVNPVYACDVLIDGCSTCSSLSNEISRIAVDGMPSSSASNRIFFRARISPVWRSLACSIKPPGKQRQHKCKPSLKTQGQRSPRSRKAGGRLNRDFPPG